uniref:Regulatory protein zeste n=1 Tax=Plectus sambesii TaxID=2011161 RepID=A0A914WMZ8_9BILA
MAREQEEVEFLKKVLENKAVLFGKLSPLHRAKDKENCWQKLSTELIAEGSTLATANTWKQLSTTRWQHCLRTTLAKVDKWRQSGAAGPLFDRLTEKWDDVDDIVYAILGKDSVSVNGLDMPETGEEGVSPTSFLDMSSVCSDDEYPSTQKNNKEPSLIATKHQRLAASPSTPVSSCATWKPFAAPLSPVAVSRAPAAKLHRMMSPTPQACALSERAIRDEIQLCKFEKTCLEIGYFKLQLVEQKLRNRQLQADGLSNTLPDKETAVSGVAMSAAQALFLFTPLLLVHLISAITNQELLDRFISPNCSVNSFDCGEKCIPINRFHDCVNDCADGLDEECWPGMIKCDGCRCVDPQDADVLCLDRQGSMISKFCNTRPETKFECNNGVCVLLKWILDGRNDCGDWSDENPCNFGYDSRCPSGTLCRFILPMSMECYCPSAGWTHNGIECVPPLANTTSTTTTTTTTSTTTTAPKCPGCVPNNLTDLYATLNTSIKFAYVLDTGVRMADDVKFLSVATQTYLIPLAATFPGRIVQYVFLPFTTTVGILETSNNPVMFSQAVARVTALGFELPICDRAIFAAFSTATPAGTPPGSIVTIFTNGGASDLSRTAAVLTDAVSRQITVNVIVSDANCDCICSWRTDKNLETIAALQLLTTLTHGFFFEMAPTANAYSAGMKIVTDMTRPDSHPFLRMSGINSLSIQKPIDSGLDAAELVAWGGNVAFEALNQISSANQYRFGGNTTSGAELLGLIPMTTYAATIVADNFTIGRMQMLGWPNVLATLSPNPFSTNPILSQSPAFGLPFYVLLGHTFSDVIQWNINFVALLNTLTGDVERSGRTVAYSNPAAPGYFAIFGPFVPPCTHFDVMVRIILIIGIPWSKK